jgi:hypothetical protein
MSSRRGNRAEVQEATEELVAESVAELALAPELEELPWWWILNTCRRMTPHIQKRPKPDLLGTAVCTSASFHQGNYCAEARGNDLERVQCSLPQEWIWPC